MEDNTNKRNKKFKKIINLRTFAMIVLILSTLVVVSGRAYKSTASKTGNLKYTEFRSMVKEGKIDKVNITKTSDVFKAFTTDGKVFEIVNPKHDTHLLELMEEDVEINIQERTPLEALDIALTAVPMLVLFSMLAFVLASTLTKGTTAMFKVLKPEDIVKFSDVAGMSESKAEVMFAVNQIKNSSKLASVGAVPTREIILEGPPGTGKTMLAKAIAGEADVPFISTSGSDFIEMFVGLGAARVRALWELATLNSPCVVFIDEIDAVGRRRTSGGDAGSNESNQTLNALLQKMDGIGSNSGIFVVAATNRVSDLDPALIRPGRFDKQLYIGPPKTKEDRDEIIKVHIKNKKLSEDVTVDSMSKLMFGMTGAEIAQVLNESVLISLRDNREGIINIKDIDEASMKLRASGVVTSHSSEQDRKITAIHEAGHALVSTLLGRKVSKISITPYSSGIGGVTIEDIDSLNEHSLKTKSELINDVRVLLAGKVAEEIVLGQPSIGSSNDIERASLIAYNMVTELAMTEDNIINIDFIGKIKNIKVNNDNNLNIANNLLKREKNLVENLISDNFEELNRLSDELLDKETILDYQLTTGR